MTSETRKILQVLSVWMLTAGLVTWLFTWEHSRAMAGSAERFVALRRARAVATQVRQLSGTFLPIAEAARWPARYMPVLEAASQRHRVAIGDVTPRPIEARGAYSAVSIAFSITGSYRAVARFLSELESQPVLVRVASLRLEPRPGEPGQVAGAAKLEAYAR